MRDRRYIPKSWRSRRPTRRRGVPCTRNSRPRISRLRSWVARSPLSDRQRMRRCQSQAADPYTPRAPRATREPHFSRSAPECRKGIALGNEQQRQAVVAPSFAAGCRTVVEDVSLVSFAARAMILGTRQYQLEVLLRADVPRDRLSKARPTGTAVEFVALSKSGRKQRGTDERPRVLLVVQRTGERPLGRISNST